MSRISLDAAGQNTVNLQDAIMARGYELWLQMSPIPYCCVKKHKFFQ